MKICPLLVRNGQDCIFHLTIQTTLSLGIRIIQKEVNKVFNQLIDEAILDSTSSSLSPILIQVSFFSKLGAQLENTSSRTMTEVKQC